MKMVLVPLSEKRMMFIQTDLRQKSCTVLAGRVKGQGQMLPKSYHFCGLSYISCYQPTSPISPESRYIFSHGG